MTVSRTGACVTENTQKPVTITKGPMPMNTYSILKASVVGIVLSITAASAASTMTGYVTQINFKDGHVYFNYDGERNAFPACANGAELYSLPFTDAGRTYAYDVYFDLLRRAAEARNPITVIGTNTCESWHSYETLREIRVIYD